ncbi:MAG: universal stress protein [Vicinamibacterales bacterium]
MFSLKRILVPSDFSECSNAALSYAREFAKLVGSRLYVLHVPGRTGENFEADFPLGPFEHSAAAQAMTSAVDPEGQKPEFAIRIGAPAEEIIRYASDRDIDLIVMGTHGRTGVSHLLMGSVAEQVLRASKCAVLVVRR